LIKNYATNYEKLTDEQAAGYVRDWIKTDEAASALRLTWISKFTEVVGAKKAAMFFQVDHRIALLQDLQLASQLPLIQP
jgi:hypothetical protein